MTCFELAEVVRNLSRDHEKGLSTGEKQMFVKAKKILASELMYAKGLDEEEAAEWLEGVLSGNGKNGKPSARRARGAAAARESSGVSVWAVLAAAGSGERLGLDGRAFASLRDRPLLAESLERLEACGGSTRSSSRSLPSGRSRRSCSPRSSAPARSSPA